MKKIILYICAVLISFSVSAKPVSSSDAHRVAVNFWNQHVKGDCPELIDMTAFFGLSEMYLFCTVDNNGFIIVADDDIATPILGYSTSNGILRDDMPENLTGWLNHYSNEISSARANGYNGDQKTDELWHKLLYSTSSPKTKSTKSVEPLIATQWDQTAPYNNKCPYDKNGNGQSVRSVTGCVATAMAQVLKFWNWPIKGYGSKTYTCTTLSPNATTNSISANFDTIYQWNMMPAGGTITPTSGWNAQQKSAVALLIFHCGVSVSMGYRYTSSSASSSDIPNALRQYFGYTYNISFKKKSAYTESTWKDMIVAEIDARRPVLYRGEGSDGTGGHSFVCDGYDAEGVFHFNWGWSGSGDGYYPLSSLTPTSTGTGAGLGDFTYDQGAVFGIMPGIQTNNSFSVNNTVVQGGTLTGTCGLRNSGMKVFSGYFGVAAYNDMGELVAMLAQTEQTSVNGNSNKTISINYPIDEYWELGTYTVKAVCSLDGIDWRPIETGYNGCATESSFTVIEPLSINTTSETKPFTFAGKKAIVISNAEGCNVSITDIMGRIVYRASCNASTTTIPVAKSGVYLVKIDGKPATKVYVK